MQTRQYNRATRTQRVKQQQHNKEPEATKTQLLTIYGEARGLRTQHMLHNTISPLLYINVPRSTKLHHHHLDDKTNTSTCHRHQLCCRYR
jgi:hypothetical protein